MTASAGSGFGPRPEMAGYLSTSATPAASAGGSAMTGRGGDLVAVALPTATQKLDSAEGRGVCQ